MQSILLYSGWLLALCRTSEFLVIPVSLPVSQGKSSLLWVTS